MNSSREWQPLGDHLALDLCNTRSSRLDPARSTDLLLSPAALSSWYASVRPGASGAISAAEHRSIIELRDATTEILDAQVTGVPAGKRPYEVVLAEYRDFARQATCTPGLPLVLRADGPATARIRHELGAAVLDLLRGEDTDRIRRCQGRGCGWFFIDNTRNHSRRWCDSAICGNRDRVRRYARRHATQ